ncbi:MAG: heme-binding domain-containing protein [Candidatus Promineifilaceae bacterium]
MKHTLTRIILIVVAAGIGLFLLIQFVPYGHDHSNPPVESEPNWDSPTTRELAQTACFDCHSNETVWPWYTNIAPVSWLIQHDVEEGRQYLNFSTWNSGGKGREPDEAIEVISRDQMPPAQYFIMHPDARLTQSEKQALMQGLQATIFR